MDEPKPFISWIIDGCVDPIRYDALNDPFPYRVSAWGPATHFKWQTSDEDDDGDSSYYGFVYSGPATLVRTIMQKSSKESEEDNGSRDQQELRFPLVDGMYFSCPGSCRLEGGSGFVVTVPNQTSSRGKWSSHRPLFAIGGPLEIRKFTGGPIDGAGRLPYIDGATDTLLLPPVVKGAPCLNHLHFPTCIEQTQHTHPSGRVGIIVSGRGQCVVENATDENSCTVSVTPLEPGTVFVIPKDSPHAFETNGSETMDVIAFHPDSDFGPTPTDHPMLNRTYVNGLSASTIPSIQTK